MVVERDFIGVASLEDILISILSYQIDSISDDLYDSYRANVIPSKTEGVAE
jgi:hypothetical protein